MMKKDNTLQERGLTEDILSKLVIENDESNQSSILGTIYMSKNRLLVIQTKIWNKQPYWDFRVWWKNDEDNFLPTKKGFMIASQHRKGDGEIVYPFNDFLHVINEVRNVTRDEEKADEMAKEASLLTTVMIQSEIDRGKDIVDVVNTKDNKGVAQSIYNPADEEFVGN